MPETIDRRLAEARQQLQHRIADPGLAVIGRRATVIRRRRSAGAATAALAVVLVGTAVAQSWGRSAATEPLPGGTPVPTASPIVYADAGLTINGVPAPPNDLSGQVIDVEFVDADHGFLLTLECAGKDTCAAGLASTDDGGQSWTRRPYPGATAPVTEGTAPQLLTLGRQVTVADHPSRVADGRTLRRYVSDDLGTSWRAEEIALRRPPLAPTATWPRDGRPQVVGDPTGITRPGCAGNLVYAWRTGADVLVLAPRQPPINVCWAAAVPDARRGFWVGGVSGSAAAVAVTYDGGGTWTSHVFAQETGAVGARVATLGRDVYVVTYGHRFAVYHSGDFGAAFSGPLPQAGAVPSTLKGDPIALLDGRLLVIGDTDGTWYVADGPASAPTWTAAVKLHKTGRLERTEYGYVAHDMTGDYTAFSVDGSTWRKLNAI